MKAVKREVRNTPLPASLYPAVAPLSSSPSAASTSSSYYSRNKAHVDLLGPDFHKALANIAAHRDQSDKNYYASKKRHSPPTGKTKQQFYNALNSMLQQTQRNKSNQQHKPTNQQQGNAWLRAKQQQSQQSAADGSQAATATFAAPKAVIDSKVKRRQVKVSVRQSVGRLAGQMRVSAQEVLDKLAVLGHRGKKLTDFVDEEVAELIVTEFNMMPVRKGSVVMAIDEADEHLMERRGPVVCVMGHVDHGKTTLLDTLRRERRALYEAGNITQSIGAFRVDLSTPAASSSTDSSSTSSASDLASIDSAASIASFLDTPGHAAFRAMRERGASSSCTDLIVLVISAVDGIQPQTVEVIELSKEHNVPLLIAINKCDLEGADPQRVKEQLCMYDIVVEDMGGDVLAVEISAKLGTNIQLLKENILLAADMLDLQAPVTGPAQCYVIESRRERGQGCVMNVVVRAGEMRVGDHFVCGLQSGSIRALIDERGQRVERAVPSMGVQLIGAMALDDMTEDLVTVKTEAEAQRIVSDRRALVDVQETGKQEESSDALAIAGKGEVYKIKRGRDRMAVAVRQLSADERRDEQKRDDASIALIIKADVSGGLEALLDYIRKLPSDEVNITVVRSGVGEVNEGDVVYADEMGAMIVGFNVPISAGAATQARQRSVTAVTRDIIYFVMDEIRDAASSRLPTQTEITTVGEAEVMQLFPQRKKRASDPDTIVAGVRVTKGELKHTAMYRVRRDEEVVYSGSLSSMRHLLKEIRVAPKGMECGLIMQGWAGMERGDSLECIEERTIPRVLDDSAARGFETVHNPKYDMQGAMRDELVSKKKRQAQELIGKSTMTYAPKEPRKAVASA